MFSELAGKLQEVITSGLYGGGESNELIALVRDYPASFDEVWERATLERQQRWGSKLFLMPPLYISNGAPERKGCQDHCQYCPWRNGNVPEDQLLRLTVQEAGAEAAHVLGRGYRDIELVSATDPLLFSGKAVAEYVASVRAAGAQWVGLNTFPLSSRSYGELVENAGAEKLYSIVWQETYDPTLYRQYHQAGPKADMAYRLNAHDRACGAGIGTVGLAFLGGLADWKVECLMALAHGQYLNEAYGANIIFGMPRWKGGEGTVVEAKPYSDREYRFVGALYSLFLPGALVWFSTREAYGFSVECAAGGGCLFTLDCSTEVGGYTRKGTTAPQFPVHTMDIEQGLPWLVEHGFQPELSLPW